MMLELLALICATLFTGAALYITIAEQPARLALDDAALLAEWRIAYPRGLRFQVPLLLASGAFGLVAWWRSGDAAALAGAVAILANMPFTLIAIMPTNHRLEADHPPAETRPLVRRWGRLHAVRDGLGLIAMLAFAVAV